MVLQIIFVQERLRHDMHYVFAKAALRAKYFLHLKGKMSYVTKTYDKRRITDPMPMKKKEKVGSITGRQCRSDHLKSGVVSKTGCYR